VRVSVWSQEAHQINESVKFPEAAAAAADYEMRVVNYVLAHLPPSEKDAQKKADAAFLKKLSERLTGVPRKDEREFAREGARRVLLLLRKIPLSRQKLMKCSKSRSRSEKAAGEFCAEIARIGGRHVSGKYECNDTLPESYLTAGRDGTAEQKFDGGMKSRKRIAREKR